MPGQPLQDTEGKDRQVLPAWGGALPSPRCGQCQSGTMKAISKTGGAEEKCREILEPQRDNPPEPATFGCNAVLDLGVFKMQTGNSAVSDEVKSNKPKPQTAVCTWAQGCAPRQALDGGGRRGPKPGDPAPRGPSQRTH